VNFALQVNGEFLIIDLSPFTIDKRSGLTIDGKW
jgi:hypothetical protein